MTARTCPHCDATLPTASARFCGQCGRTLVDPKEEETLARELPGAQPGKTVIDPAPYGAEPARSPSQIPTPLRPPPELGQTRTDPEQTERARAMLASEVDRARSQDAARAHGGAQAIPTPVVQPALVGKTMLLGGRAPDPAAQAPGASPLSRSVASPGAWVSAEDETALAPLVGAASPAPPPPGPPLASTLATTSDKRTIVGMPARDLPAPPAPQPPQAHGALRTMIGVAMPGIAPADRAAAAPPPAAAPAAQATQGSAGPQAPIHVPSRQGTMLGVAAPAIAPARAGAAAPAAPIVPAPPPLVDEPLPEAPRVPSKRGVPAVVVVAIVFVLVLALGGGAAWLALRAGAPLTAQPQLDDTGKESLKIGCPSCPDGTVVSLGASRATMKGGATVLPLPAPLTIGDNDLTVHVERPAGGRKEDVKVHVPVAYRVRADLTTLSSRPPAITVRVDALPGSQVKLDDKPVALDASGHGAYAIDLSKQTDGPSDEPKAIDERITFAITPKGAKTETGQLFARTTVVPLHIDAPGLALVTEKATAAVAGQTRPGSTVTIDGQSTAVDAQGRFAVRVELPASGDKTIEIAASSPPLAPRIVKSKITRVASVEAAVTDAASGGIAYDAFGADPKAHAGEKAVVDGDVVEARAGQGYTVLLVDEKKACPKGASCIVRVVHGDEDKVARGDAVRIVGRIVGSVSSGGGKTVPDIEASIVAKAGR